MMNATPKITVNQDTLTIHDTDQPREVSIYSMEGFQLLSDLWVRSGWHHKYSYSFTWLGIPMIQLPEDVLRLQEVIYSLCPDLIIETGVANGGSLIFYASLCKALDKGRVVGIDIEIRPHNRQAIEGHPLFSYITLLEGSSTADSIVQQVQQLLKPSDKTVLVILDSNHTHEHVLRELELYSPMVSAGSYIVATDGIMQNLAGDPRTQLDWTWNNPQQAARDFVQTHPDFQLEEPVFLFNEGQITQRITYWPNAYIRRLR